MFSNFKRKKDYNLYEYKDENGDFDYKRYKEIQEEGNKGKIEHVWVLEGNIKCLSQKLKEYYQSIEFGICHGTRRGLEQQWFRKYLDCEVIGTEISSTAKEFPNTIQWDFHEINPEWTGKADFVYSNSFDHAYDPQKALDAWMSSLKDNGVCILEHSRGHLPRFSNELDPFGVTLEKLRELIPQWGDYKIIDEFDGPAKRGSTRKRVMHYIWIAKT